MGTLTYVDPKQLAKPYVTINVWRPVNWLPFWRAELRMSAGLNGRSTRPIQIQYLTAFSERSILRASSALADVWMGK